MNPATYTRRVYALERTPLFRADPIRDIKYLRALGEQVWNLWTISDGTPPPTIVAGRGVKYSGSLMSWYTSDNRRIVLSRHQRKTHVLLHEVAHAIVGVNALHGPRFCSVYHALLREYWSKGRFGKRVVDEAFDKILS